MPGRKAFRSAALLTGQLPTVGTDKCPFVWWMQSERETEEKGRPCEGTRFPMICAPAVRDAAPNVASRGPDGGGEEGPGQHPRRAGRAAALRGRTSAATRPRALTCAQLGKGPSVAAARRDLPDAPVSGRAAVTSVAGVAAGGSEAASQPAPRAPPAPPARHAPRGRPPPPPRCRLGEGNRRE